MVPQLVDKTLPLFYFIYCKYALFMLRVLDGCLLWKV